MTLSPGTSLDHYEISGAIGSGGMGEVYRARDTKLGREVAVKALPAAFASDPERLARFEREAQALAALNHPNIAVIHELKEVGGSKYLILELVEGKTLAETISAPSVSKPPRPASGSGLKSAGGALPVDRALELAGQIAAALEAAHDKGIVHRDLKPANIKITPEGRVKVLDFGLAKLLPTGTGEPADQTASPTLSAAQTMGGMILGTAAYMSPEQARGKEVDRRADIWAFGCVLYEMLTGRQTFPQGETLSDTLAGILAREPDWQALPAGTPPRVRSLLERCLRKDERRRWGGIADVRYEIDEARSEMQAGAGQSTSAWLARRRRLMLDALALVFLLITIAAGLWLLLRPAPEVLALRSEYLGPTGTAIAGLDQAELSPDGRKLAFLARSEDKLMIWVRTLGSTAQPLRSTEGSGTELFWSADSQFIAFSAEGKLKKVAYSGGPAQVVAELPGNAEYAGTWNADDEILIGSEGLGPLLRVPSAGGQLAPLTELDKSRKETAHAYPSFLPDGKHYLYLARSSDPQRAAAAYVGELDSKEKVSVPGIASEVKYSAAPKGGYLVFIRDGALMAQPFDVKRLQAAGEAFPMADAFVEGRSASSGPFSVSASGGLAYLRPLNISGGTIPNTQFAWFDRKGKQLALAGPPGPYIFGSIGELLRTLVKGELRLSGFPELSPDGKLVSFSRDTPSDIWILDIEKSLTSRLTSDPAEDSFPVWSPDGRTIAFRSTRDGLGNLYTRAVGAVEEDKPMLKDEASKYPSDWSRDGKYITYFTSAGDIWALPVSGDSGERKPLRVTQTKFNESDAKFSPDGRWIAYVSNEPGQSQVYIQSFPAPGFKQQVSTAGGIMPRWSRDGKELFYIEMPNLMAVSVKDAGSSLQIGTPASLFSLRVPLLDNVAADGRFLSFSSLATGGATTTTQSSPAHIVVIQNWAATAPKRK
jgi:serine/threonine protein kinase/Tol biopolymer transport system component